MRRGRVSVALATGALVAGATACGSSGSTTVDATKLERDIRNELEQSNRVQRVVCPGNVKAETGARFTCLAIIEGTRQVIDVRLTGKQHVVFALRS